MNITSRELQLKASLLEEYDELIITKYGKPHLRLTIEKIKDEDGFNIRDARKNFSKIVDSISEKELIPVYKRNKLVAYLISPEAVDETI